MKDWNKPEIIEDCLSHIEEDFLPFNDVYRSIYGISKEKPSLIELQNTFELISFLLNEKNVVTIYGPEMKPSGKSTKFDLQTIQEIISNNEYQDYHYGIWFDSLDNWK
jgi:hypothetical protein